MGELTPGDTFRQQMIGLQRRERVPSLAGAVAADGHVAFSDAVGLADIDGDVQAGPCERSLGLAFCDQRDSRWVVWVLLA